MLPLEGPLRNAANNGDIARVRSLLDQGADPDSVNQHGETALHVALARGHHDVVQVLLQAGSRLDIESKRGWTPLSYAAAHEDLDAVELMVNVRDPPVEALNDCLVWAIRVYHSELVALLLAHGAEANRSLPDGRKLFEVVEVNCDKVVAEYQPRCREIVSLLKRWKQAGVP